MKKSGRQERLSACDSVRVTTKDAVFEGLVMPSSDDQILVLKLKTGYNAGIEKTNITSLTKTGMFKGDMKQCAITLDSTRKKTSSPAQKGLPVISVLHTGGTIASEIDYETGGVVARFTPEELLAMFPELQHICNLRSKLIGNMFSEDMRFAHYNIMAQEIQKEIRAGAEGIIITHGTDTLAYTASALAFILEGINIPVILVGAQRSSDRGSSDAAFNLIRAAQFIAKSHFAGVGICMHETSDDASCFILPACTTRKFHSSRRDAFKPVHGQAIARIQKDGTVEMIQPHASHDASKKLTLRFFKEHVRVGILKVHPHMDISELTTYQKFNGLILEGTGMGHFPINAVDKYTKSHKRFHKTLAALAQQIPVFMTSQTIYGRVDMHVYSTGRKLLEAGVLGNYNDMLTETAFIKMAWALSNYPKKDVPKVMMENLRGELSARTIYQ